MSLRFAPLAIALAFSLPAHASDTYTVDPKHTLPHFEISHYGFSTIRGSFRKSGGRITLDRAAKSGSVDIAIDTASINTGLEDFDAKLRSEDFFDAEKYPRITYKSERLVFSGDALVAVEGQLAMHGVTHPVTLFVTSFKCGPHAITKREVCGADAEARIRRSDFGLTRTPGVSDAVRLLIPVEAHKDEPATAPK